MAVKQTAGSIMAPDGSQYVTLTDGAGNLAPAGTGPIGPGGGGEVEGANASGTASTGNPVKVGAVFNTTLPTVTTGQVVDLQATNRGVLKTQLMDGTTNPVTVASAADGASGNFALFCNAFQSLFNGVSWERGRSTAALTTVGNAGQGVCASSNIPTSMAGQAMANTATTAVASNIVLKASAGNLYSVTVAAGASAGYVLVYDATSAPADGATTPVFAAPVAANAGYAMNFNFPIRCATGITLVFSTTGPFTKTASATAFLAGQFV